MNKRRIVCFDINSELPDHHEAKRIVTHFIEQINQNGINLGKTELLTLESVVIDYNEQRINLLQFRSSVKDMMDMYVPIEQVSHGLAAATVLDARTGDIYNQGAKFMTINKDTAELYRIRSDNGSGVWADVVLIFGNHSVEVLINSDYGHYAYYWTATGDNPRHFLTSLDMYYAMDKLSGYKLYEHDMDGNLEEVKEMIIEARKEYGVSREEAREAWNELVPIAKNFVGSPEHHSALCSELVNSNHFVKIFGDYTCLPSRKKIRFECKSFWENIWIPLMQEFKKAA